MEEKGAKSKAVGSEPPGEDGQSQVGGARSNMSGLDKIEQSFRGAITHFEESNKITLEWFRESKRRIADVTSKIETNRKKLQGLQQQVNRSVTEIAACRARAEVNDDRISQLEQKVQDLTETIKVQAQLAENLQAQQLLGEAALKETREKVEKLEEAAQPVTISVPYLQWDHYFEQPQT